ncbi:MAG: class II aldolase/adducin family protein [Clostridiaceae bacterium]|jgi:ribulose-5-phosphate 4-epimerase/fuculose-1-phosphate aldolase|nr:class II aldolase/adducin family protein [Clostridiaceae bacterium]
MQTEGQAALQAAFDKLRRGAVPLSRVRIVWRQTDGRYLYAVKDPQEAVELTADQLEEAEPAMAAILKAEPGAGVLIRSLPEYAYGVTQIRNLRSFRPPLDDALQMIGGRLALVGSHESGRIPGIFQRRKACIVRPSQKRGESEPFVLTLGSTPLRAAIRVLILEKACRALIEGTLLGGIKRVSPWHAIRKLAAYPCPEVDGGLPVSEGESYGRLAHCLNQLLEENLIQTAPGAVAVRLDESHFLMARGCGDDPLTPEGVVRVKIKTLENDGGLAPSFELRLHAAIMNHHAHADCVILTRAGASSVFAACRQRLDAETGYAPARIGAVMKALGNSRPTCILGNRGALVMGESVRDTLDRCRALEDTARRHLSEKVRELRG